MRVLIVEDEERIAAFMAKGLRAEGHNVEHAPTVRAARDFLLDKEFDAVLLDLMLPDGDGREVLATIRQGHPALPVIVVSARGDIDDKVGLLDLGADDYLVKPFAFAELVARLRAATRESRPASTVLEVGPLKLDTLCRIATHGDTISVDLPSREFALLDYLMRHPNQVLTRQQILDAVWDFGFDTASNVVDVYVGYLRKKLDRPGEDSVIETVRGAGYRVRV